MGARACSVPGDPSRTVAASRDPRPSSRALLRVTWGSLNPRESRWQVRMPGRSCPSYRVQGLVSPPQILGYKGDPESGRTPQPSSLSPLKGAGQQGQSPAAGREGQAVASPRSPNVGSHLLSNLPRRAAHLKVCLFSPLTALKEDGKLNLHGPNTLALNASPRFRPPFGTAFGCLGRALEHAGRSPARILWVFSLGSVSPT